MVYSLVKVQNDMPYLLSNILGWKIIVIYGVWWHNVLVQFDSQSVCLRDIYSIISKYFQILIVCICGIVILSFHVSFS